MHSAWNHEDHDRSTGAGKHSETGLQCPAPSEKFLTDITEVQCADGKLYVSPIMDCFSGEIVALEMRDNMKKELCIDTVRSWSGSIRV